MPRETMQQECDRLLAQDAWRPQLDPYMIGGMSKRETVTAFILLSISVSLVLYFTFSPYIGQ